MAACPIAIAHPSAAAAPIAVSDEICLEHKPSHRIKLMLMVQRKKERLKQCHSSKRSMRE